MKNDTNVILNFKHMSIGKVRFIEMAVFAFIAFILLATSPDSAWADRHHAHWLYVVVGILSALFAVFKLIQIAKTQSTQSAK